jgi:hypothetical protein
VSLLSKTILEYDTNQCMKDRPIQEEDFHSVEREITIIYWLLKIY